MPVPPPPNAKRVFKGEIMDFWQWEQPIYDGTVNTYECVTRPDTCAVIPFLDEKTVLLTRQEQPSKPEPFLDFPGGRVDPDEVIEEAVRREMAEETSRTADRWMEWHHFKNVGMYRFEEGLYIATGLHETSAHLTEPDEKIELLPTPWDDVVKLCLQRKLRQPNIMLAVLQMEFDPASKKRLQDWLRG
ncbi:MAG: NUDIX hydrolase [Patescibacteria group bacterium]